MSKVAQIAKFAGKVAKSPMGKLGIAAVAGGVVASIFSGCKKVVQPNNIEIQVDSTLYHQLDSLLQELDSVM